MAKNTGPARLRVSEHRLSRSAAGIGGGGMRRSSRRATPLERFHFRSGATGGLSARVSGGTGSKLPVAPDGEKVKPL